MNTVRLFGFRFGQIAEIRTDYIDNGIQCFVAICFARWSNWWKLWEEKIAFGVEKRNYAHEAIVVAIFAVPLHYELF